MTQPQDPRSVSGGVWDKSRLKTKGLAGNLYREKLDFPCPLSPAFYSISRPGKKLEASSLEDTMETSSHGDTSTGRMEMNKVVEKEKHYVKICLGDSPFLSQSLFPECRW